MNWFLKSAQSHYDKEPMIQVNLLSVHSYQSGDHGDDDHPEVGAEDCFKNPEWELDFKQFDPQVEALLRQQPMTIQDNCFYSYHECQVGVSADVYVSQLNLIEMLRQMIPAEFIHNEPYHYNSKKLRPFINYEDAIKQSMNTNVKLLPPPSEYQYLQAQMTKPQPQSLKAPKPDESSNEFWNRAIEKAYLQNRDRKYEGD